MTSLGIPGSDRVVWHQTWPRKPNGGALPRNPAPNGHRPPNRLMWAHTFDEFCWISRYTDIPNIRTMWSRSMIKEFGELYNSELEYTFFECPEYVAEPRKKKPWPVLKIKGEDGTMKGVRMDPTLGVLDEGCDHERLPLRVAIMVDSDDDVGDGEDVDGTVTTLKLDGTWFYPFIDMFDWRRMVYKTRTHQQTGFTYYYVKPPSNFYSMSLAEVRRIGNNDVVVDKPHEDQKVDGLADVEEADEDASEDGQEDRSSDIDEDEDVSNADSDATMDCTDEGGSTPPPNAVSKPEPAPKINHFSTSGIPKLEEKIPAQYFPDTLVVHDPYGVSMGCDDRSYGGAYTNDYSDDEGEKVYEAGADAEAKKTTRDAFVYKRVYPVAPPPTPSKDIHDNTIKTEDSKGPESTAHLYMYPKHRLGVGHHSHVYLSPLELPDPLTTFTSSSARPGTVLVAAKLAIQQRQARDLLAAEAKTYNEFPEHLSDEYCGLHLLSPFQQTLAPSCAVVPRFYGYYVPVYHDSEKRDSKGKLRYPWQKRSPILLMEHCGTPIEASKLTRDERADCYSLLMRMHMEEVHHGSFYERNIVVQPGPLTKPPVARSLKDPSFRVIDFGRTISWPEWLKNERGKDMAAYKADQEAIRRGEKKASDMKFSMGGAGWWDKKKRDLTEEEALLEDLDNNPYWRCFESKMAEEWREARKELGFDQVEPI